jgi:hypothetical protein
MITCVRPPMQSVGAQSCCALRPVADVRAKGAARLRPYSSETNASASPE